jgi:hypothetical protein
MAEIRCAVGAQAFVTRLAASNGISIWMIETTHEYDSFLMTPNVSARRPPAAERFIVHGSLQQIVRRHGNHSFLTSHRVLEVTTRPELSSSNLSPSEENIYVRMFRLLALPPGVSNMTSSVLSPDEAPALT